MKVSALTGVWLDYWVAKANAPTDDQLIPGADYDPVVISGRCFTSASSPYSYFSPSINWAHGGPIIERRLIHTQPVPGGWSAQCYIDTGTLFPVYGYGETLLQAAMRCFVASKFGSDVESPTVAGNWLPTWG